jgi:DNA repair exonuclease SbcCD ATPase subunit
MSAPAFKQTRRTPDVGVPLAESGLISRSMISGSGLLTAASRASPLPALARPRDASSPSAHRSDAALSPKGTPPPRRAATDKPSIAQSSVLIPASEVVRTHVVEVETNRLLKANRQPPRPHTSAGLTLGAGARAPGSSSGRPLRGIESASIMSECSYETLTASALSAAPPWPSWELSSLAPSEPYAEGRPHVPAKFAQITSSPLFEGKGVSNAEWEEIFRWTGAVWLRKDYPNESAHFRRNEALALHRLLDLMLEDASANMKGPLLMARFEVEQPVYETIRAELRKQVSVKCKEQAWLLERIFARYDDHLGSVQPVFRKLDDEFRAERMLKKMALAELGEADETLAARTEALVTALGELENVGIALTREKATKQRLQHAVEVAEASTERLREELGETAERNERYIAATKVLRARLESHDADLARAKASERKALEECERLALLQEEADEDAREYALQLREASEKYRQLADRFAELERDAGLARERNAELEIAAAKSASEEASALRELRKIRTHADAAQAKLEKTEATSKARATRISKVEADNIDLTVQLEKLSKANKALEFDRERLEARVEMSKEDRAARLRAEAELRQDLHAAEQKAKIAAAAAERVALLPNTVNLNAPLTQPRSTRRSQADGDKGASGAEAAAGAADAQGAGGEGEEAGPVGETEEEMLERLKASAAAMRAKLDAQEAADAERRLRRSRRKGDGADDPSGDDAIGAAATAALAAASVVGSSSDEESADDEGGTPTRGGQAVRRKVPGLGLVSSLFGNHSHGERAQRRSRQADSAPQAPPVSRGRKVARDEKATAPKGAASGVERKPRRSAAPTVGAGPSSGRPARESGGGAPRRPGSRGRRAGGQARDNQSESELGDLEHENSVHGSRMHGSDSGSSDSEVDIEYGEDGLVSSSALRRAGGTKSRLARELALREAEAAVAEAEALANARNDEDLITALKKQLSQLKSALRVARDGLEQERTRRKQKEARVLMLQKQLSTLQEARSRVLRDLEASKLEMAEASQLTDDLQVALDGRPTAAGDPTLLAAVKAAAAEAGAAAAKETADAEHSVALAALSEEVANAEASYADHEQAAAETLREAELEGEARLSEALRRAGAEMEAEIKGAQARAGAAEQNLSISSRKFSKLEAELAEAVALKERQSTRLMETRTHSRHRIAELSDLLREREEQLRKIIGVRALGPVHAALDDAGIYEAKENKRLAQLAEQAIRLAVALDEAHEHNRRLSVHVQTLRLDVDRLHARTNGLVQRQLLRAAQATAGQGAQGTTAGPAAHPSIRDSTDSLPSHEGNARSIDEGVSAAPSDGIAPGPPSPSSRALTAAFSDLSDPAIEGEGASVHAPSDAAYADAQPKGLARKPSGRGAGLGHITEDLQTAGVLLTSKHAVGKLVDVARRLKDERVAIEVEAVNRGHVRIRNTLEKIERELHTHAPSAVHEILTGAPELPPGPQVRRCVAGVSPLQGGRLPDRGRAQPGSQPGAHAHRAPSALCHALPLRRFPCARASAGHGRRGLATKVRDGDHTRAQASDAHAAGESSLPPAGDVLVSDRAPFARAHARASALLTHLGSRGSRALCTCSSPRVQARIGIDQLQQMGRLDQSLSQVRALARDKINEESEWLKMWVQRRVDVEQSAVRAMPLILDDVDRAKDRLLHVLDGVRIPDEAFHVQGVPSAPAITNLDGGDFSVTVCYRRQSKVDSHKMHVFNYTSQDDSRHNELTRRLVKQTLALLQINPLADAKAKDWELRTEQIAAGDEVSQVQVRKPSSSR